MQIAKRITAQVTSSSCDHISQDRACCRGESLVVHPEMSVHAILRKEIIVQQRMRHFVQTYIAVVSGAVYALQKIIPA